VFTCVEVAIRTDKVASYLRSERPTSTPSEMTPIHIDNGTADCTNFSKSAAEKAVKKQIKYKHICYIQISSKAHKN